MDKRATLLVVLLILGTLVWFYSNCHVAIDFKRSPHLLDNWGENSRPTNVILQTPEYINSTTAQQRLYDLQYVVHVVKLSDYELAYQDGEQQQLSAWPIANQTLCIEHLDWIIFQLRLHPNHTFEQGELARQLSHLLDSFGRPPSGLLEGSLNWMGSYTQCMGVSLDHNGAKVNTRYCIARARPNWWPSKEIVYPPTGIQIAVCLPETCDTNSFNYSQRHRHQIELFARHELPELYKNGLHFESLFCLPDERSPIRQLPLAGKVYLLLVGVWLVFVLVASLVDLMYRRLERPHRQQKQITANGTVMEMEQLETNATNNFERLCRQICWAVSVHNCIKELLSNRFVVDYKRGQRLRVDLRCLDFVKVTLALMVIYGHAELMVGSNARKFAWGLGTATSDRVAVIQSFTHAVETFFVLAGILASHTMMRKLSTDKLASPLVWLKINVRVFLRIAPIFTLVYWYARLISPYTASGPSWDYGINDYSLRGKCAREGWWYSIPYFATIARQSPPFCTPQGWFLSCYARIWLILPLITYVLAKFPSHFYRFALTSYLVLASVLSLSIKLYAQNYIPREAFTIYGGLLVFFAEPIGYTATLSRFGQVAIGLLAGYFLHLYQQGKITSWPKWINSKLSELAVVLLHLLIIFLPLIGKFVYKTSGELVSKEQVVISSTLVAIAWPLLNAIAVIQMSSVSNHHLLVRFFSHGFWHSLGKLTFCMFMVHWEIELLFLTASERGPSEGYLVDMVSLSINGIFLSIVASFFLYILIEAPLSRLMSATGKPKAPAPTGAQGERAVC